MWQSYWVPDDMMKIGIAVMVRSEGGESVMLDNAEPVANKDPVENSQPNAQ